MAQYLSKFKDVIGKKQVDQILRLLQKRRNTGQIRTLDEFTNQLENLIRELQQTDLSPTITLYEAEPGEIADSDTYNFMLDRVEDDLDSAFAEALNIDEVQRSHEGVIRDIVLKNLRAGVAELSSKVSVYEFINKDGNGFDSAIFSTFRESKENRTDRGSGLRNTVFVDPKTNNVLSSDFDANVEVVGERLTLASRENTYHNIAKIRQVFDDNHPQSEIIVEPPNTSLSNIIDNTIGTYWIQSLLYKEKKNSVKLQLELSLGSVKEINFLEIEPASRYGFVLEEISYLDGNNIIQPLSIGDQIINNSTVTRFRKIATNKIILTFRNDNFSRIHFKYNENNEPLFFQAARQPVEGIKPATSSLAPVIDELFKSERVKSIIGFTKGNEKEFVGYEFVQGFDNIRLGLGDFENKGLYISKPLTLNNIGQIGLKTVESRPFIDKEVPLDIVRFTDETYDFNSINELQVTSGRDFQNSIEYWILKEDYNNLGNLIKTAIFPIIPIGVGRIHQERLVLNEKSDPNFINNDIGTLANFTNKSNGNIRVFKNGIEISNQDTTPTSTEGWVSEPLGTAPLYGDAALRTPNNGSRMRFKIKVLNPIQGDIYTVTYTPLTSTTKAIPTDVVEYTETDGLNIVDLTGDLSARLDPENIITFDNLSEDGSQIESKVYLIIMLRQNTADSTTSAAVEEYTLFGSVRDQNKFEEL